MKRFAVLAAVVLAVGSGVVFAAERRTTTRPPARPAQPAQPAQPASLKNPLLPQQVVMDGLMPDMGLIQTAPMMAPATFDPLYTADDWAAYRAKLGSEADDLRSKRSSGHLAFAAKLIEAASDPAAKPGFRKLCLVRAVAVSYRNSGSFATSDKAITLFQEIMDIERPADMAALWTMTNTLSRYATTPKPDRIRYSGIAAKANMQLVLELLRRDQLDAAQNLVRLLHYHEGWLKNDGATRAKISQVRGLTGQTVVMLEYLGRQYDLAVKGNESALLPLYLYATYVKPDAAFVQQVAARGANGAVGQLHQQIEAAKKDPTANYTAAEALRGVATTLPDGVLKRRTLYGALQMYRAFLSDPATERERVKRTLARMHVEAVVADGAHGPTPVRIYEPVAAATQPATQPTTTAIAATQPTSRPATQPSSSAGGTTAFASR